MKNFEKMLTVCLVSVLIILTVVGIGRAMAHDDVSSVETTTESTVAEAVVVKQMPETFCEGIDISQHQGNINAMALNTELVVVRLGYSGYGAGALKLDSKFMENMSKLSNFEGKVALYWASHAINVAEINRENEFIVNAIKEANIDVEYIFIDRERTNDGVGRADNLSREQFNAVLSAQIDGLSSMLPDVNVGVYTNVDYLVTMVDIHEIGDVPYWIAWYGNEEVPTSFDAVIERTAKNSVDAAEFLAQNIVMWQYSETGEVDGINGAVDLNLVSSKMLG